MRRVRDARRARARPGFGARETRESGTAFPAPGDGVIVREPSPCPSHDAATAIGPRRKQTASPDVRGGAGNGRFSDRGPHGLLFPDKALKERFVRRFSNQFGTALVALILLTSAGTRVYAQAQGGQAQARSRADETLEWWNQIGNKLIAMAKDFPEDKYDFRVQKEQRTFAENLLHVAAVDYDLVSKVAGSKMGPDFGKDAHNPSRDVYKTKATVVKLIEQAVAEGAAVLKQQGDAGLDKTQSFGWETGKHVVHNSYIWLTGIE